MSKNPDSISQTLNIKVQDIDSCDVSSTQLPPSRLMWMKNNFGYTSVKSRVY